MEEEIHLLLLHLFFLQLSSFGSENLREIHSGYFSQYLWEVTSLDIKEKPCKPATTKEENKALDHLRRVPLRSLIPAETLAISLPLEKTHPRSEVKYLLSLTTKFNISNSKCSKHDWIYPKYLRALISPFPAPRDNHSNPSAPSLQVVFISCLPLSVSCACSFEFILPNINILRWVYKLFSQECFSFFFVFFLQDGG